jgi:hypothetical protein
MNIILSGGSRKIFEFFSGYPQKVFKSLGRLIDVQAAAQIGILSGDSHRTFAGVAHTVLLATDGDQC